MFGQIKENIYYSLELVKNNPEELKAKFNSYFAALKESKQLTSLHELYEMVEKAEFDNEAIALQFIDEALAHFSTISDKYIRGKKSDLPKLTALVSEGVNVQVSDRVQALDNLLFNTKLTLKEKYDHKTILIKDLTKANSKKKVDRKEIITNLDKKVHTQVSKLTTEQKDALEVFMENDESKINNYYNTLIESTINLVESKLLNEDDVHINKSLIATRQKLQQLKTQKPTIDVVDSILDLKSGF